MLLVRLYQWLPIASVLTGIALSGCKESPFKEDTDKDHALVPTAQARPSSASQDAGPADGGKADNAASVTKPVPLPEEDLYPPTLEGQREAMFRRMRATMRLTDEQMAKVEAIFDKSKVLGQGNPKVAKYAMTRKQCREARESKGVVDEDKPLCGAPFMVPIFDRDSQVEADAKVCIDRYEFPGIPCEYPVVWVKAIEAAELCTAVGKRLCDAHEWEGACAGSVRKPELEYAFGKNRVNMARAHNQDREITWAYGSTKDHKKCAMSSFKSDGCTSGGWKRCGSNTYPAGSFPECTSPFGVYDQHGNAAEHMSLPMKPEELVSRGGMGSTEMKGSWFIFSTYEAHIDDCRWRAPDWHGTKVMHPDSHANYHLGFRCCKSIGNEG